MSLPPVDTTRPRRSRRIAMVVVVVLLLVAAVVAWRMFGSGKVPHPGQQAAGGSKAGAHGPGGAPTSVSVATIGTGNIRVTLSGLGAVTPLDTVTVVTQINGQLQSLGFEEGQLVHKGQFLAQIDPRPYLVALEQAQGTLAHDEGLLAQARADSARYQLLNRQNSIAVQQAQDELFLIKQYEGTVIADQAAIDSAKLNLVYCHIVSPVTGRVGIRLVDPGNYVQTTNTGGLFVVTQLQPISVLFTLPEDDIPQVQEQMAKGVLPVTAYDRSDAKALATGTLAAVDTQIDNTTGTVELRATFPNPDNTLFPQQFVNAHLLLQTLSGVVVAPQAAVQHGAPGDFVYLVKPDNTVAVQVVKTGPSEGGLIQITDGLKAGDKVATDGLDRLRNGGKISVAGPRKGGKPGAPAAASSAPASPSP
ncbi:efflux RND transporter periplasmic adaptor subunit [Lichenicola sp.]|uniref:efflux RND transporter periplasmic adaptor subunit n=1 Tax=Lichenicola sp. TaxID=2804529 RepID=UPI003B00B1C9